MVTARKIFKEDSYYMEYMGLHADPKPVDAKEGDVFKELDTDSVYKFEGGKWTFSPGGASGEGLSDGIDIIGTDKELKDLSGIAVGFDLPDEPDTPDIVLSTTKKNVVFGNIGWVKLSDSVPFETGYDLDDLSLYEAELEKFLDKPIYIEGSLVDGAGNVALEYTGIFIYMQLRPPIDNDPFEAVFYMQSSDDLPVLYYLPAGNGAENEKGFYADFGGK